MSKPSSRAVEVVRDQLVALVAEVAHENPGILSVEGFDLSEDQNNWINFSPISLWFW